jgi:hypothetical protein
LAGAVVLRSTTINLKKTSPNKSIKKKKQEQEGRYACLDLKVAIIKVELETKTKELFFLHSCLPIGRVQKSNCEFPYGHAPQDLV